MDADSGGSLLRGQPRTAALSPAPSGPAEGTRRFPPPFLRRADGTSCGRRQRARVRDARSRLSRSARLSALPDGQEARRAPSAGRRGDGSGVRSGSGRRCLPPAGRGVRRGLRRGVRRGEDVESAAALYSPHPHNGEERACLGWQR